MIRNLIAASVLFMAFNTSMAAECKATVDSNDQMSFNTKHIDIPKACKTFTVTLTHSGKLPRNVMGHNWVLSKEADIQSIATDGTGAGLGKNYLKDGDARIIAHTKIIGPKESDSVTFPVSKLSPGEKYGFFCSFPGHFSMMKGSVDLK
ncbi:azurin [Xanthomonas hyacinthi]|uniref:Azurin n=1 Tax=Xanthomonas hyacinthi TaxID=56455 RepID=A0A2S7F351_9XANT|nr:azurin [Xanthomonas hyacinthi]KLD75641.1 azurin [Xanthomonas hyacinthi DSM 19077]PPU99855.1 azurin [Xanthomonas hyacinthi]QGY76020.1 azurin [Xanthomonas hyacinthi]